MHSALRYVCLSIVCLSVYRPFVNQWLIGNFGKRQSPVYLLNQPISNLSQRTGLYRLDVIIGKAALTPRTANWAQFTDN